MPEDWRNIATGLHYRGLEVTLIGTDAAGLLAIVGYGTPEELAIGAISVELRDGQRVYCLAGTRNCVTSAKGAAETVIRARQARDAHAHADVALE